MEDVISLGTASPLRPEIDRVDWEFSLDEGNTDPVLGVRYVSEVYQNAELDYSGRPTVPVITDITTRKAVNNDYFTLTNQLETAWEEHHSPDAPDLYPVELREEIDAFNEEIFHKVNNGVYKCGFAHSQEAYEKAFTELFLKLDELEEHLSHRRFIHGDYITDSDVRLYTTLARFDAAYYNGFNTNRNLLREMKHLWDYARDLYQTPGFGDTTDFEAIKQHYHLSITINPNSTGTKILPKGPDLSAWNDSHRRAVLSGREAKFRTKGSE